MQLDPQLVALIRAVIREEMAAGQKPAKAPKPPPPKVLAAEMPIPRWEARYSFKPRKVSQDDLTILRHLRVNQHAARWLPDPNHNPFTKVPVPLDTHLGESYWRPPIAGVETLMPVNDYTALTARCFASANRKSLSPRALYQGKQTSGQGLVGDATPPMPYGGLETLEWTRIPQGLLQPLRSSYEHFMRPLDGAARPPLPNWFEPVHPFSVVVTLGDWVYLFGPRSPAFGRPVWVVL